MADQRQARDEAIARVEISNVYWTTIAMQALRHVASHKGSLTSDDVWHELRRANVPNPSEPRAMGPVMVRGVKEGILSATDRTRISDDPASENHSRPQRVYLSRIDGRDDPFPAVTPFPKDQRPSAAGTATDGRQDPRVGRPFPLRRGVDGAVTVTSATCEDCGEVYSVLAEHLLTYTHRRVQSLKHAAVAEQQLEAVKIPQPVQTAFTDRPTKLDFGTMIVCPRCKNRRHVRKGHLEERVSDPHKAGEFCIRCNGWGIIPS